MKILITGSSGLIGSALKSYLEKQKHEVVPMLRHKSCEGKAYWNIEERLIEPGDINGFDAAVHLAGENIGYGRWSAEKKSRILKSRINSTRLLTEFLCRCEHRPRVFISASAVGFYGDCDDKMLMMTVRRARVFCPIYAGNGKK